MAPPFPPAKNDKPLSLWDVGEKAERDFNLPRGLLRALGMEESSGFNHWDADGKIIESGTGPRGALQFTKKTAREMGINRDDPIENVLGGAKYLRQNYDALNGKIDDDNERWLAAAVAHNRGLGAVQKMIRNRRFEPSGKDSGNGGDTRDYATRIANNWANLRGESNGNGGGNPVQNPPSPAKISVGGVTPETYAPQADVDAWEKQYGPLPEETKKAIAATRTPSSPTFPTAGAQPPLAPQITSSTPSSKRYTKRDVQPGEKYYEFEKTGEASGNKYLGMVGDKYRFETPAGDEIEWDAATQKTTNLTQAARPFSLKTDNGTELSEVVPIGVDATKLKPVAEGQRRLWNTKTGKPYIATQTDTQAGENGTSTTNYSVVPEGGEQKGRRGTVRTEATIAETGSEWRPPKGGKIKLTNGTELTYVPDADTPDGKARFRDADGETYLIDKASGQLEDESLNETGWKGNVRLVGNRERNIVGVPEAQQREATQIASQISPQYNLDPTDAYNWLLQRGFTDIKSGQPLPSERYYQAADDRPATDEYSITRRQLRELVNYGNEQKKERLGKLLEAVSAGTPLSPELLQQYRLSDKDLSNASDDVAMAATKGKVAQEDLTRRLGEIRANADTPFVRAAREQLGNFGLDTNNPLAARLIAARSVGQIDEKDLRGGLADIANARNYVRAELEGDAGQGFDPENRKFYMPGSAPPRPGVSEADVDARLEQIQKFALTLKDIAEGNKKAADLRALENGPNFTVNNLATAALLGPLGVTFNPTITGELAKVRNALLGAPALMTAGDTLKMVAGVLGFVAPDTAASLSRTGGKMEIAGEGIGGVVPATVYDPETHKWVVKDVGSDAFKATRFVTKTAAGLIPLILASESPLGMVGGFAATGAARKYGEGATFTQAGQEGAKQGGIGAVFNAAEPVANFLGRAFMRTVAPNLFREIIPEKVLSGETARIARGETETFGEDLGYRWQQAKGAVRRLFPNISPELAETLKKPANAALVKEMIEKGESFLLNPEIRKLLTQAKIVKGFSRIGTIAIGTEAVERIKPNPHMSPEEAAITNVLMDTILTYLPYAGMSALRTLNAFKGKTIEVVTRFGKSDVTIDGDGNVYKWDKVPPDFVDATIYENGVKNVTPRPMPKGVPVQRTDIEPPEAATGTVTEPKGPAPTQGGGEGIFEHPSEPARVPPTEEEIRAASEGLEPVPEERQGTPFKPFVPTESEARQQRYEQMRNEFDGERAPQAEPDLSTTEGRYEAQKRARLKIDQAPQKQTTEPETPASQRDLSDVFDTLDDRKWTQRTEGYDANGTRVPGGGPDVVRRTEIVEHPGTGKISYSHDLDVEKLKNAGFVETKPNRFERQQEIESETPMPTAAPEPQKPKTALERFEERKLSRLGYNDEQRAQLSSDDRKRILKERIAARDFYRKTPKAIEPVKLEKPQHVEFTTVGMGRILRNSHNAARLKRLGWQYRRPQKRGKGVVVTHAPEGTTAEDIAAGAFETAAFNADTERTAARKPTTRTGRAFASKKNTLLDHVRAKGINPDLGRLKGSRGRRSEIEERLEGIPGIINRKSGISVAKMAESAVEAGYFPDFVAEHGNAFGMDEGEFISRLEDVAHGRSQGLSVQSEGVGSYEYQQEKAERDHFREETLKDMLDGASDEVKERYRQNADFLSDDEVWPIFEAIEGEIKPIDAEARKKIIKRGKEYGIDPETIDYFINALRSHAEEWQRRLDEFYANEKGVSQTEPQGAPARSQGGKPVQSTAAEDSIYEDEFDEDTPAEEVDTSDLFDAAIAELKKEAEPAAPAATDEFDEIANLMGFDKPAKGEPYVNENGDLVDENGQVLFSRQLSPEQEAMYEKLRGLFESKYSRLEGDDATRMKAFVKALNDRFSVEQLEKLKPFVVAFVDEKRGAEPPAETSRAGIPTTPGGIPLQKDTVTKGTPSENTRWWRTVEDDKGIRRVEGTIAGYVAREGSGNDVAFIRDDGTEEILSPHQLFPVTDEKPETTRDRLKAESDAIPTLTKRKREIAAKLLDIDRVGEKVPRVADMVAGVVETKPKADFGDAVEVGKRNPDAITGVHVTGDAAALRASIGTGNLIDRPEDRRELGPGLYISKNPAMWEGRVEGKPEHVEITAAGKFIEFDDAPYLTADEVKTLVDAGYDGAFTPGPSRSKAHAELVIWNAKAIYAQEAAKPKTTTEERFEASKKPAEPTASERRYTSRQEEEEARKKVNKTQVEKDVRKAMKGSKTYGEAKAKLKEMGYPVDNIATGRSDYNPKLEPGHHHMLTELAVDAKAGIKKDYKPRPLSEVPQDLRTRAEAFNARMPEGWRIAKIGHGDGIGAFDPEGKQQGFINYGRNGEMSDGEFEHLLYHAWLDVRKAAGETAMAVSFVRELAADNPDFAKLAEETPLSYLTGLVSSPEAWMYAAERGDREHEITPEEAQKLEDWAKGYGAGIEDTYSGKILKLKSNGVVVEIGLRSSVPPALTPKEQEESLFADEKPPLDRVSLTVHDYNLDDSIGGTPTPAKPTEPSQPQTTAEKAADATQRPVEATSTEAMPRDVRDPAEVPLVKSLLRQNATFDKLIAATKYSHSNKKPDSDIFNFGSKAKPLPVTTADRESLVKYLEPQEGFEDHSRTSAAPPAKPYLSYDLKRGGTELIFQFDGKDLNDAKVWVVYHPDGVPEYRSEAQIARAEKKAERERLKAEAASKPATTTTERLEQHKQKQASLFDNPPETTTEERFAEKKKGDAEKLAAAEKGAPVGKKFQDERGDIFTVTGHKFVDKHDGRRVVHVESTAGKYHTSSMEYDDFAKELTPVADDADKDLVYGHDLKKGDVVLTRDGKRVTVQKLGRYEIKAVDEAGKEEVLFNNNRYLPADKAPAAVAEPKPAAEAEKPKALSNTQVELAPDDANMVALFRDTIDKADIAPKKSLPPYAKDGIHQIEPHITVKYGLHTNNAADIEPLLKGEKPITAKLGKLGVFPASEKAPYDVLYVSVESPDLERINAALTDGSENTTTHPYKPHLTIAYLKPGTAEKYLDRKAFEGHREITFDKITFSPADKSGKVDIPLASSEVEKDATPEPSRPTLETLRGDETPQNALFDQGGRDEEGLFAQGGPTAAEAKPETPAVDDKAAQQAELIRRQHEAERAERTRVFGEETSAWLTEILHQTGAKKGGKTPNSGKAAFALDANDHLVEAAGGPGQDLAADSVAAMLEAREAEVRGLSYDDYIRQSWLGKEELTPRQRDLYDKIASGDYPSHIQSELVRLGKEATNAPTERGDLAPDSGGERGLFDGVREEIPDTEPARDDGGPSDALEQPEKARPRPAGDNSLFGSGPVTGGEGGDQHLRPQASADKGRGAGVSDTGRSGAGYDERASAEYQPSDAVREAAERSRSDVEEKRRAQNAAEDIEAKHGDLDNIRRTLPFLHDHQQDDVHFIETRFSTHDGVMLTNGTGTGKTYVGLGAVKRFHKQGKTNGIIVAPNDKILADWQSSALNLNLRLKRLVDTQDNGGAGTVLTTYANFRQNKELVERPWDFIVFDEAHNLGQNKDGNDTSALAMMRAVSLHPRGAWSYHAVKNAEQIEKVTQLGLEANKALKKFRNEYDRDKKAALRVKYEAAQAKLNAEQAILDAAQRKAMEEFEARREKEPRTKVTFLSATPFAYEKNVEYAEGYLFDYGPDNPNRGYGEPNAKEQFFMTNFGYRMRYGKLTKPDADVNTELMEQQFNAMLQNSGALSGRRIDIPVDYSRQFVAVESAIGKKIDEGFDYLWEQSRNRDLDRATRSMWTALAEGLNKRFNYLAKRFTLEAINARAAIPIIRQHLDMGRKVVVFHDYNKNEAVHPFDLTEDFKEHGSSVLLLGDHMVSKQHFELLKRMRPDLVSLDLSSLVRPQELYEKEFGDIIGFFNGTVPTKKRRENLRDFNDDNGKIKIFMAQADAGKEGISAHDTTGKFQRVLINLGLPTKPTAAIQTEGRIYRDGTATDAIQLYMTTGTNFEQFAFGQTISSRSSTAENLALGAEARALRDAFINGYMEADPDYKPSSYEGRGGKEADRSIGAPLSDFDRAKGFYFGQAKKTSRNKAAEGADYYATPEPVGLKMVEWAHQQQMEHALEPSAGHGAIARWFRPDNYRTVVEPSETLAARLAMATDARLVRTEFEDLHHGANKADTIVMNPPFGTGGKTAIEHVAKAFKHLNNGGRVVALIPQGSSTDKRLAQLLESDDAKHIVQVGDIKLPTVTFKRAATSVATHIVIFEKQTNEKDRELVATGEGHDLSHIDDIKQLFDEIEHVTMPERVTPTYGGYAPQPPATPSTALTRPPQEPPGRAELEQKIIDAYRAQNDKDPETVEIFEHEGDDGKWHSAFGVPWGVKLTGKMRSVGFAYKGKDGAFAVGNREASREILIEQARARRAASLAEFEADIRAKSDKQLNEAADHYLDGIAIVSAEPPVRSRSGTTSSGDWVVKYKERGKYSGNVEEKQHRFWRKGDAQAWIDREVPKSTVVGLAPGEPMTQQEQKLANDSSLFDKKEFNHTQTGETKYVARLKARDEQNFSHFRYKIAPRYGGYYSKFAREGAIPGFLFKSADARDKFIDECEQYVGGTRLRAAILPQAERVQYQPPYTTTFLENKQFAKLEGKAVKIETIRQVLKQPSVKAIERDIVETVLDDPAFVGQTSISWDAFKEAVQLELMPLRVIESSSYASYGIDNTGLRDMAHDIDIGDGGGFLEGYTHIYNTDLEHGVTGHFSGDFGQRADRVVQQDTQNGITYPRAYGPAWEIVERESNGRPIFLVIREGATPRTEEEMQDVLGTVTNSREAAQQWIDAIGSKANVNKGMFGHTRVAYAGDKGIIVELQSDVYQKHRAEELVLKGIINNAVDDEFSGAEAGTLKSLALKAGDAYTRSVTYNRDVINAEADLKKQQDYLATQRAGLAELERIEPELDRWVEQWQYATNGGLSPSAASEQLVHPIMNDERLTAHPIEATSLRDRMRTGDPTETPTWAHVVRAALGGWYSIGREKESWKTAITDTQEAIERIRRIIDGKEHKQYLADKAAYNNARAALLDALPLKYKQFIAHRKNYTARLLREEVRNMAQKGLKEAWVVTPRTAALVEGFLSDDSNSDSGPIPYTLPDGTEPPADTELLIGDKIKYLDREYTVVEQYDSSIVVAPSEDVHIFDEEEEQRSQFEFAMEQAEAELSEYNGESMTADEIQDLVREQEGVNRRYTLVEPDGIFETDPKDENKFIFQWEDVEDDVEDSIRNNSAYWENSLDHIDQRDWDHVEELGNGRYRYVPKGTDTETLEQPSQYSKPTDVNDFNLDDYSGTQRTILDKYVELNDLVKREYPNAEVKTDPRGNEYIGFEIPQDTLEKGVRLFSRELSGREAARVSDLGFYSQAEQAVLDKMPQRATAEQIRGILSPANGVKNEELEWLDIDSFLKANPKPTKDEVLAYIRANGAEVTETVLSQRPPRDERAPADPNSTDVDERLDAARESLIELFGLGDWHGILAAGDRPADQIEPLRYRLVDAAANGDDLSTALQTIADADPFIENFGLSEDDYDELEETWDNVRMAAREAEGANGAMDELYGEAGYGETRYDNASYRLPGGKEGSYRELLLTMPAGRELPPKTQGRIEALPNGRFLLSSPGLQSRSYATRAEAEAELERLNTVFDKRTTGEKFPAAYASPHFDVPNIIGHIRFDERDIDGKRYMHIAELQSDWAKEGREKGYIKRSNDVPIPDGFYITKNNEGKYEVTDREGKRILTQRYDTEAAARGDLQQTLNRLAHGEADEGAVPDMPFKKSWPMLLFKRALRYAVETGYDGISWDTGATNADRYDLRHEVHGIDFKTTKDGTKHVTVDVKKDGLIVEFDVVDDKVADSGLADWDGKRLDQMLGKEIAKRIDESVSGTITGEDLRVGGTGMHAFYSEMLPNEIGKYIKKWGGKVEGSSLDTGDRGVPVHAVEINDAMRESVARGQKLFAKRTPEMKQLLTDVLPNAPVSTVLPGIQSQIVGKNLELTPHAAEMIRRLIEEQDYQAFIARPENKGLSEDELNEKFNIAHPRAYFGAFASDTNDYRGLIRTAKDLRADLERAGYDGEWLKGYDKLIKDLHVLVALADRDRGGYGIVYVFDEHLPEEELHLEDLRAGRTDRQSLEQLQKTGLWKNPGARFTLEYPSLSPADKASEIAAALATGQAEKYGWTKRPDFETERDDFLRTWLEGILRRNEAEIREKGLDEFFKKFVRLGAIHADTAASQQSNGREAPADQTLSPALQRGGGKRGPPYEGRKEASDRPAEDRSSTENEKGVTGIRNRITDEERAKRGLPPAMRPAKSEFGDVWDRAMRELDANPDAAVTLVEDLKNNPRPLDERENSLLLHRQITLQNAHDQALYDLRRALEAGDTEAANAAMAIADPLLEALHELYDVNRAVGTENARGLSIRRMLAKEDYTLARMTWKAKAAAHGDLTKEEQARLEELHEAIAEATKDYDEAVRRHEKLRDDLADIKDAIAEARRELADTQKTESNISPEILEELKKLKKKYADKAKETELISQMLEDAESLAKELQAVADEAGADVEAARSEAAEARAGREEAETALDEATTELEDNERIIENLKRQVADWKKKAEDEGRAGRSGVSTSGIYKKLLAEKADIMATLSSAFPGKALMAVEGEPVDYVSSEYEDGWYVEKPDPKNVEKLVQVKGPFPTERAADQWIKEQASKLRSAETPADPETRDALVKYTAIKIFEGMSYEKAIDMLTDLTDGQLTPDEIAAIQADAVEKTKGEKAELTPEQEAKKQTAKDRAKNRREHERKAKEFRAKNGGALTPLDSKIMELAKGDDALGEAAILFGRTNGVKGWYDAIKKKSPELDTDAQNDLFVRAYRLRQDALSAIIKERAEKEAGRQLTDKELEEAATEKFAKSRKMRGKRAEADRWYKDLTLTAAQRRLRFAAKAIGKLWEIPRRLITIGHGGVIPFTHARTAAFVPGEIGHFLSAVGDAYSYLTPNTGNGRWARDMAKLQDDKMYDFALRHKLDINVDSLPVGMGMSRWTLQSFDALKTLRLNLFKKYWNDLDEKDQTPEAADDLAKRINHATGVVDTPPKLNKIAQKAMFAPKLRFAKYASAFVDPLVSKFAAKRLAKIIAVNLGLLLINWLVNKYFFGTNDEENVNFTDPGRADWLRLRLGGVVVPMAPTFEAARLPFRLGYSILDPDERDKWRVAKTEIASAAHPMIPLIYGGLTGEEWWSGKSLPFRGVKQLVYGENRKAGKLEGSEYVSKQMTYPEYLSGFAPIPFQPVLKDLSQEGLTFGDRKTNIAFIEAFASGILGEHLYEPKPPKPEKEKKPLLAKLRKASTDEIVEQLLDKRDPNQPRKELETMLRDKAESAKKQGTLTADEVKNIKKVLPEFEIEPSPEKKKDLAEKLNIADVEEAAKLYRENAPHLTSDQRFEARRKLLTKVLHSHQSRQLTPEAYDAAKEILGGDIKFDRPVPGARKQKPIRGLNTLKGVAPAVVE